MEKDLAQSEAKRLLLDKCLRGEFALSEAGLRETAEVRPQAAPYRHSKVAERSLPKNLRQVRVRQQTTLRSPSIR